MGVAEGTYHKVERSTLVICIIVRRPQYKIRRALFGCCRSERLYESKRHDTARMRDTWTTIGVARLRSLRSCTRRDIHYIIDKLFNDLL